MGSGNVARDNYSIISQNIYIFHTHHKFIQCKKELTLRSMEKLTKRDPWVSLIIKLSKKMQDRDDSIQLLKIIVLGNNQVGKSSLITRFIDKRFVGLVSTVGSITLFF